MEAMGLYDSDTGDSLNADHVVDLGLDDDGQPLALLYCTAKRGRIVQIRIGSLRVHYFVDESLLDDDAERVGRWLCMNGANAIKLIRERATQ